MKTGVFLGIVVALVAVILGLEIWTFYQHQHETISELSRIHPYLRWTFFSAIVLFGIWWVLHTRKNPRA